MRNPWLPPLDDPEQRLAQIYGETAGEEWQQVRRALTLGEDFRLIVLVVPDNDAAELCKQAAQALCGPRHLADWRMLGPENLYELPARLVRKRQKDPKDILWIQAVLPETHGEQPAWQRAWAEAMARLNERRDVLRSQLRGALILCGAPWIVPVLRDAAPDLWSVRTLVARIRELRNSPPQAGPSAGPASVLDSLENLLHPSQDSVWRFARLAKEFRPIAVAGDLVTPAVLREVAADQDPQLALSRAAMLRAPADRASRSLLSTLLLRAAYAFALRRNARETERLAGEVWGLSQETSLPPAQRALLSSQALGLRAWARLLDRHPGDAVTSAEQALREAHSIGMEPLRAPHPEAPDQKEASDAAAKLSPSFDSQTARTQALRLAGNVLWLAQSVLGNRQAADEAYQAWQQHEGHDPRQLAADHERLLALTKHLEGKPLEAAALLEKALRLQEEAAAPPTDRAHTLAMLADCALARKDFETAERRARRALLLYEADPEGPEISLARGLTHALLSHSLCMQQRFRESVAEAQRGTALLAAAGASFDALYRIGLTEARALALIGQIEPANTRLQSLLARCAALPPSPENLKRQVLLAELLHTSFLWLGQGPQGLRTLADVDRCLESAQAPAALREQIMTRLRVTNKFRWLLPLLGPLARFRLWLFRHGLDPGQWGKGTSGGAASG